MQTYFTHDNGGRPFKVVIDDCGDLCIYKNTQRTSEDDYDNTPFWSCHPNYVFVGKSPLNSMTKYSGGHGPQFDGNSLLVEMPGTLKYVFVGTEVFVFTTLCTIREFVSMVGNNDVPYPYAVDVRGNYYLLIENVVLINNGTLECAIKKYDNPYKYYYNVYKITSCCQIGKDNSKDRNNHVIKAWFIGDDEYELHYKPNPGADYERIIDWNDGEMTYIDNDGNRYDMTKEKYIETITSFGAEKGFQPLDRGNTLHRRL